MRWDIFLLAGVFIAFFLWLVLPMARRSAVVKRRAKLVMAGREPINPEQFANGFAPSVQRNAALGLREATAHILIVDVAKIRQDDRLVGDLGFGQINAMDIDFLDHDLRERFGVAVAAVFIDHDPTVRELVELCSSAATKC